MRSGGTALCGGRVLRLRRKLVRKGERGRGLHAEADDVRSRLPCPAISALRLQREALLQRLRGAQGRVRRDDGCGRMRRRRRCGERGQRRRELVRTDQRTGRLRRVLSRRVPDRRRLARRLRLRLQARRAVRDAVREQQDLWAQHARQRRLHRLLPQARGARRGVRDRRDVQTAVPRLARLRRALELPRDVPVSR